MDAHRLAARIAEQLGDPTRTGPGFPAPPEVADHELVQRIGSGSYGEVWLARSITGQWRAVKIVSRSRFESDRPYEREFRGVVQFEPISRSHGALIQVLHVGRDDRQGAFYYVMELADGETSPPAEAASLNDSSPSSTAPSSLQPSTYRPLTLRSKLEARQRLPISEVVALGVQLCGALGHIHRHGLVHRDVKPSNVIFVQGQAKLADLGLVATTDEARTFVGTEGFIPPEGPGTVKADLFALGRLLYETATGKDRCEFPELPSDLDQWPDRERFLELNEVLTRLCAPDPNRRLASAAEAAGDLNLVLAGRSVRQSYELERRLQRSTRVAATTLVVLVAALLATWFLGVRKRQAESRAIDERILRERAQAAEHDSQQKLHTALYEQARATVRSGELGQRGRALQALRGAAAIRNTPELRREAIAALALPDLQFQRELPYGPTCTVRQLDPAFERAAIIRGSGPVEIWSVSDGRLLHELPASTNLTSYNGAWSPDSRFLCIKRDYYDYSPGGDLEVWRVDETPTRTLHVRNAQRKVRAYHPSLPLLMTGHANGRMLLWNLEHGTLTSELDLSEPATEAVHFSPDGSRLGAVHPRNNGCLVAVYDSTTGQRLASANLARMVMALAWHPDGTYLATTDLSGTVHLMDARTGSLRALGRHRAEATTAVFESSGKYLITGGWERSLICWDLRSQQRSFVIELDSYALQMASDGTNWALLTPAGIQLHTFQKPLQVQFNEDLGPRLRLAAFSPDARWIAASADERLGVWDLQHPRPAALATEGSESRPYWAPDGLELFASKDEDKALRWRLIPGDPSEAPRLESVPIATPAGFAWLSLASNLLTWTTTNGSQIVDLEQLEPRPDGWRQTAFGMNALSRDAKWLAIYRGYTQRLSIYERPELELVTRLTSQGYISGFAFSTSGHELAVASRGQVEFWNTSTWQPSRVLTNFAGIPYIGVLAHPDGSGWWLARDQRFACLHDAESMEVLLPLPSSMSPLALSSDGRWLAVSVEARRLEVWDLALLRSHLRDLGCDWNSR